MCLRCDGYSEEEVERGQDLIIRVHGFLRLDIDDDPDFWSYTVGLMENFDHPELLCFQGPPALQRQLVQDLGMLVVETGFLDPFDLADLDVELVPMHEDHTDADLVGSWRNRYDGRVPLRGEFLQVLPGPSWFYSGPHAELQRLDTADPIVMTGLAAQ